MSGTDLYRNGTYGSRRTATTATSRARAPSSRLEDAEVRPSDSASNAPAPAPAPPRRIVSGSHKANGVLRGAREKRAEKDLLAAQVAPAGRAVSPTKAGGPSSSRESPRDAFGNARNLSRYQERPARDSPPVAEKVEKKQLRTPCASFL